jgi:hypothetical protein
LKNREPTLTRERAGLLFETLFGSLTGIIECLSDSECACNGEKVDMGSVLLRSACAASGDSKNSSKKLFFFSEEFIGLDF